MFLNKNLSASLIMSVIMTSCVSQVPVESIPLYDTIPNSKPSVDSEKSSTAEGVLIVSNVSIPTLTIYRPPNVKNNATAVIICPGGGYGVLAAGHEGSDVAKVLNEWGVVAVVLKYRLPDEKIMNQKSIGPLQDAQRAIQIVRTNAGKWNINPDKIGIMGFSAGGHLASTASTHFATPVIGNPGKISLRPDFSVLIYPVVSFTDSIGHIGSRTNLLGENPSEDEIREYSNELQVNGQTPPAFLVHANDDDVVKVGNSVHYYEALTRNHVPAELRLYPKGGHGFGMRNATTSDNWMDRLKSWLKANRFI
jgi:acetyl esterase/lipase